MMKLTKIIKFAFLSNGGGGIKTIQELYPAVKKTIKKITN